MLCFVSTVNVKIAVVMASDMVLDGESMLKNGVVSESYGYRNQFNVKFAGLWICWL